MSEEQFFGILKRLRLAVLSPPAAVLELMALEVTRPEAEEIVAQELGTGGEDTEES